ncbi:secretory carrier-associated membrane protein 2-like protein [Tanacetum coccineum]
MRRLQISHAAKRGHVPTRMLLFSMSSDRQKCGRLLQSLVKRKEVAATRAGIVLEEKNWPPFFPIIHHDIANEIPIHLQKLQYVAFTTYLGLVLCLLLWNIIATTTAWIKGEGVQMAYVLWYRPFYHAFRWCIDVELVKFEQILLNPYSRDFDNHGKFQDLTSIMNMV